MNPEHAETHLRQLAEAELRRATTPGALGAGHVGSLPLVAQALIAVGAVDVGTADEIQAELDLALAARQASEGARHRSDRPAAQGGHPVDRRSGHRAIGPGPGQAAGPLDVESLTATGAGCWG